MDQLIAAFEGEDLGVELELLADPRRPRLTTTLPTHYLSVPGPEVQTVWLQVAVPWWQARNRSLFHCPWYALPFLQRRPSVVTLHDLTFEHRPAGFSRSKLRSYQVQARWAARVASAVAVPSAFVGADVAATYGVDPGRIVVTANAVDAVFLGDVERPRPAGLPDRYVVAMGGAARRRLDLAIEAWALVRADDPDLALVVVGEEPPAREGLLALGSPDDETWAATLANAEAFVYTTEYEGFGMPGLEACAVGTAVVAAQHSALPEVLGDAASWSASLAPTDVAAALRTLLDDRAAFEARARARAAAAPTWRDTAVVLADLYQGLAA